MVERDKRTRQVLEIKSLLREYEDTPMRLSGWLPIINEQMPSLYRIRNNSQLALLFKKIPLEREGKSYVWRNQDANPAEFYG